METRRNKKVVLILSVIAIVSLIITLFIMLVSTEKMYALIFGLIFIIDLLILIIYLNNTRTSSAIYNSSLKYILRTFDSVLAYLDCDLDSKNKQIVKLEKFDDLVNCQEEMKKPILFKCDEKSAFFGLIDKDTIYFTTLKEDVTITNELEEKLLKEMNKKTNTDDSLLDDIDKTTIIKTTKNKKYKVSPIRDKDLEKTSQMELPKLKKNDSSKK